MTIRSKESELLMISFESFLRSEGKEASTVRLYLSEVEHFLASLQEENKTVAQVRARDLLKHRDKLLAKGMKTSTINKRMSVLSTFFRWTEQYNGIDTQSITKGLRLDESDKADIRWLTEDEERLVLSTVSKEKSIFRKTRNKALIAAMLFAGLRVEEVSHLRLYSLQESVLHVYDETSLKRSVPADARLSGPLLEWLDIRRKLGRTRHRGSEFLFVTERSGYMQPRAVQFVVESLSEKLGFPVTCQIFRHTYCRRLVREGASAEQIQKWAGHKSLVTTFQYFS